MRNEKKDYLPVNVNIILFPSQDIVTSSGNSEWLDSDGNVDSGGWTDAR